MIVGIFNIRGGGSRIKRKRIISIIQKGKENMFLVQETKMKEVLEYLVMSFGGMEEIGYSFSKAEGMPGGLLTLWKAKLISVIFQFSR